jgi:asparagine synthase (glutamine-hydrolysing)
MCGIAGIVGPRAADHAAAVSRMIGAMAHRGPDGEGLFVAPSGECVLGHRRLAILDLTPAAAQPMSSADGRFTFVYNGELYNFRELQHELEGQGERFTSTGDTEILLRLLSRSLEAVLPRLNGMFAFGLWDERERRLLVARDRFGQKPLYWASSGGLLIFASEVRALLESGLVARQIDREGMLSYLSYGAVQGPRTIVRSIALLPAASMLTVESDGPRVTRYWAPSADRSPASDLELREAFVRAVDRHLIADAPLGLFLSGGIDSSAITSAAARLRNASLTSLCVTFPDQPEQCEAAHARRVAQFAGTEHREIPISGSDLLALLPRALEAMDQPTGDGVNTFLVSHAARLAGIKCVLAGVGGDELFGGYSSFRDVARLLPLQRVNPTLRSGVASLLSWTDPFSRMPAKMIDLLDAPDGVVPLYLARRKTFSSRQLAALGPALVDGRWSAGVEDDELRDLERLVAGRHPYDAVGLLELTCYMREMLLRDADVMGMSRSLEIRLPFLDAEFATRALAQPPETRKPGRFPKQRFTDAIADLLPRATTRRRKQGFELPFQDWMLHDLRGQVKDGIEALAKMDLFAGAQVRSLWERFLVRPNEVGWFRPWSLFSLGGYLQRHRLAP